MRVKHVCTWFYFRSKVKSYEWLLPAAKVRVCVWTRMVFPFREPDLSVMWWSTFRAYHCHFVCIGTSRQCVNSSSSSDSFASTWKKSHDPGGGFHWVNWMTRRTRGCLASPHNPENCDEIILYVTSSHCPSNDIVKNIKTYRRPHGSHVSPKNEDKVQLGIWKCV